MECILKHTINLGVISCQNVKIVGLKQKSLDTIKEGRGQGELVFTSIG